MTALANPARPARWLDRAFQIRLPVFVVMVAGVALVSWAGRWYLETRDVYQAMTREQLRDLKSTNLSRRRAAADLLDGVNPALLGETARALMVAMKDPDAKVRHNASRSLASSVVTYFASTGGQAPPEHHAATVALVAAMSDSDPFVRAVAIRGLESFTYSTVVAGGPKGTKNVSLGFDSKVVVPAIRKAIDDPDPKVATAALRAIQSLKLDPADTLAVLRRLARSDDLGSRIEAIGPLAQALKGRGEPPDELVDFVEDPHPGVRNTAVAAFSLWGDDPRAVAGPLADRLANHADLRGRASLIQALAAAGETPGSAVPALIRALDGEGADNLDSSERDLIREYAPAALANASPADARAAMPALLREMRRGASSSQSPAAAAMLTIGPDHEEARAMAAIFERQLDAAAVRGLHAGAVGGLSRLGQAGLPGLRKALGSFEASARDMACVALQGLGPQAASALPELANLARKQLLPGSLDWPAADAIFAIAPRSPEAGAFLVELLESPDHQKAVAVFLIDLESRGIDPAVTLRAFRSSCPPAEADRIDAAIRTLVAPR